MKNIEITKEHLDEIKSNELMFGSHASARAVTTKTKRITYQPLTKLIRVYVNGERIAMSQNEQEMIDLYNSISIR